MPNDPIPCARTTVITQGFTLIELLVVVAIIAVLAGLLMPALNLVRTSAKGANCASNQRQIHLAIGTYANDNDGAMPRGWWGAASTSYISWDDLLSNYDGRDLPLTSSNQVNQSTNYVQIANTDPKSVKLFAMYTCPAETFRSPQGNPNCWTRTYALPSGFPHATGPAVRGVYAPANYTAGTFWNFSSAGASDWAPTLGNIRPGAILLAEIRYPFAVLGGPLGVTVDNPWSAAGGNANGAVGQVMNASGPLWFGTSPLHGASWNYLFADGHVERLNPSQTVQPGTALNGTADGMWLR